MVAEAVLADELGWDFYGNGEQHFVKYAATVATPQLNHSFIAARTSNIRLRPMSVNVLPYNHPVRIAEDLVSLDILSGGRAEFGGARSNNPWTLDAFGIDPKDTKAYRNESLAIIAKALAREEFEHHSDLYDIPLRSIPRPIQQPAPPINISATGVASHENARHMGIGVMTGNSILGWEYAQSCLDAYKNPDATVDPIGDFTSYRLAFSTVGVNCAPTYEEAKEIARPVALAFVEIVLMIYSKLSTQSPDYAYLGEIEKIRDHADDLDWLISQAPYITIGTPDDLIERATTMHAMGADDLILRLDGMGHEKNLAAIELIGREVLPAVHALPEHPESTPFGTTVATTEAAGD
jgi:alkanesulfonate monooxygenase SsuD/methylene tetrahydromethanopterin reductase-like flavin-dependent oxidoreductase (luciferase family)